MFNNIQIYQIKAENPMINNTSTGKQMHIANENGQGNRLVEPDFFITNRTVS